MAKDTVTGKISAFTFGNEQVSVETDGKISYYRNDEKNSVTEILDEAGKVQGSIQYDEYGVILNPEVIGTNGNIFSYTGHLYEESTGLYYAKARYYDAKIGRFISEDSYRGEQGEPVSLNLYVYVQNNPVKYTDPSGYMAVSLLRGLSDSYNSGFLDNDITSFITLALNGLGIYTALHEIAQLNIAKKLTQLGKPSILEYQIKSKTEKNIWGKPKKVEADVVSGEYVWEVKPRGTDGTKQLKKYMDNGNLKAGNMLSRISDIPVYQDYFMEIEFDQPGIAHYSLYKKNKSKVKVYVTNAELKKEYYKDLVKITGATAVATGIIAFTLAEDVATGGLGVADDPLSFAAALKILEAAFAY